MPTEQSFAYSGTEADGNDEPDVERHGYQPTPLDEPRY
jgi:hypothetical protein